MEEKSIEKRVCDIVAVVAREPVYRNSRLYEDLILTNAHMQLIVDELEAEFRCHILAQEGICWETLEDIIACLKEKFQPTHQSAPND